MPTRALSGARMVRDLGVTNEFLAPNVAAANKIQQVSSDRLLGRDIRSSGTGNSSQVQPWYDVPISPWNLGGVNGTSFQYYLSSVRETNSLVPPSACYSFKTFNFPFAVGDGLAGAILAPNGKLYCTGDVINSVVVVDPTNDTVSSFGNLAGSMPYTGDKYEGAVLHPNGKIYLIPNAWSFVGVVDPSNNTISSIGGLPGIVYTGAPGVRENYSDAVVAPNGKIYMFPDQSTMIIALDPSTNTFEQVVTWTAVSPPAGIGYGGILGFDGKIYVGRYRINPSSNSIETWFSGGNPPGAGLRFGLDGKIYSFGWSADPRVYRIDPTSSQVETIGTWPGTGVASPNANNIGYAQLPNGCFINSPNDTSLVSLFDPSNNTFQVLATITGLDKFDGVKVVPNGKVYFIPRDATSFVCFQFMYNNDWNMNVLTSPMFNRNYQ